MKALEYVVNIEGKEYTCYQSKERLYFKKEGKWQVITNQYPRLTFEPVDGRSVPQRVRFSAS